MNNDNPYASPVAECGRGSGLCETASLLLFVAAPMVIFAMDVAMLLGCALPGNEDVQLVADYCVNTFMPASVFVAALMVTIFLKYRTKPESLNK